MFGSVLDGDTRYITRLPLESCEAVSPADALSDLAATIERKTAQQTKVFMTRVAYAQKLVDWRNQRYHSKSSARVNECYGDLSPTDNVNY